MTYATLDEIIKRSLLEKGLPIHFYCEYLYHQASAVRELCMDTLQVVNTVNLPIDNYGAANLPNDYEDEVAVCFQGGGYVEQIPHQKPLNPMRQINSSGDFVPYNTPTTNGTYISNTDNTYLWGAFGLQWYWNVNDYGEPFGAFFGTPGGTAKGYQIFPQRRQIQLTPGIYGGIVLMYISNGQSVDNATQIPYRAISCIQAYSEWKRSKNANFKDSPEARTFYNEKRMLKARMNPLTVTDIKNVIRNNFHASIKN